MMNFMDMTIQKNIMDDKLWNKHQEYFWIGFLIGEVEGRFLFELIDRDIQKNTFEGSIKDMINAELGK